MTLTLHATNVRRVSGPPRGDGTPSERASATPSVPRALALGASGGAARRFGARVQSFVANLVGKPLFWVLFILATFSLPIAKAFTRQMPHSPPPIGDAPPFELLDQDARRVGSEELRGVVWCVGFAAMSESEVSDSLTKSMAKIRFRTRNLSNAFHLVTITLDPERDGQNERIAYAQRFHAAAPSWSFLGGDVEAVRGALAGFHITLDPSMNANAAKASDGKPSMADFSRRERLVLVDKLGKVRGYYQTDPSSLDAIVADIGMLANDTP